MTLRCLLLRAPARRSVRIVIRPAIKAAIVGFLLTLLGSGSAPSDAQNTPLNSSASSARFHEKLRYPTDPFRLRRTVNVDGDFNENEWDPFYTVDDQPIKGTVYCNWDKDYLYIAARTDQPSTVVFDMDLTGDGWLRGTDNLELVIGSVGPGNAVNFSLRVLDAEKERDSPKWKDLKLDKTALHVSGRSAGGFQFVQAAIPRGTAGLVLRPAAHLGMRAEFFSPGPAASFSPTPPFEPHMMAEVRLMEAKSIFAHRAMAETITPRLTISDRVCVPGQKLFGTLELVNLNNTPVAVKSVEWTGKGSSASTLSPVHEDIGRTIASKGRLRTTFKTVLPANLQFGSYTLSATAVLEDGKQAGASTAFSIVDPIHVQIAAVPMPVILSGQATVSIHVQVASMALTPVAATIDLVQFPDAWILNGVRRHDLRVEERNTRATTRYALVLPVGTPAGDYPIEAVVKWNGQTWKAQTTVRVQRP